MTSQAGEDSNQTSPRSALVIDDDPAVSEVLTKILSNHMGYEAKAVQTGEAAIDLLARRDFDVILLDFHMPMLNGKDLFNLFESMDETLPRRVIFCTGQLLDPATMPFLEKHKNLYLLKPFNKADIELVLGKFFSRK